MLLFLPQSTLEEWAMNDRADLKDGRLVVTGEDASFAVHPAVHFVKVVSGTDDATLLQKVKTTEQLVTLGADHFADSVVMGETAYEVVPGYVAEVDAPRQHAAPARPGKDARKPANAEADLLAAFILDKMS